MQHLKSTLEIATTPIFIRIVKKKSFGFNRWAAFYSLIWCAYKKFYKLAAIISAYYLVLIPLYGYITHNFLVIHKSAGATWLLVLFFLPMISMGFIANKIVINRAKKDIEKIVNSSLPEEYFEDALYAAGEPNIPGAVAVLIASALLNAASKYAQNLQ